MSRMLLSIKPEYVNKIVAGKKKYEFRKFHCREGIDTIVIYATAPMKKVIGEVALLDIIEGDVGYVWHETRGFGGILKKDYKAYYKEPYPLTISVSFESSHQSSCLPGESADNQ